MLGGCSNSTVGSLSIFDQHISSCQGITAVQYQFTMYVTYIQCGQLVPLFLVIDGCAGTSALLAIGCSVDPLPVQGQHYQNIKNVRSSQLFVSHRLLQADQRHLFQLANYFLKMTLPLTVSSTFLNTLKSLFPGFSKIDGGRGTAVTNARNDRSEGESPGAFPEFKDFVTLDYKLLMSLILKSFSKSLVHCRCRRIQRQ